MIQVTSAVSITSRQIADQVVAAIEGGVSYWMKSFRRASSTNPITVKPWYDDEHFYDADFSIIVALHDAAAPKVITQKRLPHRPHQDGREVPAAFPGDRRRVG